jgi:hypothetical protein
MNHGAENMTSRYNTSKKCPQCSKATSVTAGPSIRKQKIDGCTREIYLTDAGVEVVGYYLGSDQALIVPCRGCGKLRVAKKVYGVFKADKGCDGRCMAATGHTCECSCGGANHGASHAA